MLAQMQGHLLLSSLQESQLRMAGRELVAAPPASRSLPSTPDLSIEGESTSVPLPGRPACRFLSDAKLFF